MPQNARSRVVLLLDKTDDATKAWVTACWRNGRKDADPPCPPVGIDLAALSKVPQPMRMTKAA